MQFEAGDESRPRSIEAGEPFEHRFRADRGPYELRLRTRLTEAGDRHTLLREFDPQDCLLLETNFCGCAEMEIRSKVTQSSGVYCGTAEDIAGMLESVEGCEEVEGASGCPAGQSAYRCQLGPLLPHDFNRPASRFGWKFEVRATIDERTNDPSKCRQGQFVRATQTMTDMWGRRDDPDHSLTATCPKPGKYEFPVRGFEVKRGPRIQPVDSSFLSPDNHCEPSFKKRHDGNTWRWLDAPSFGARPKWDQEATQAIEFVAWVEGNLDTCWCGLRLEHQWRKGAGHQGLGGGAAPTEIEVAGGYRCKVP